MKSSGFYILMPYVEIQGNFHSSFLENVFHLWRLCVRMRNAKQSKIHYFSLLKISRNNEWPGTENLHVLLNRFHWYGAAWLFYFINLQCSLCGGQHCCHAFIISREDEWNIEDKQCNVNTIHSFKNTNSRWGHDLSKCSCGRSILISTAWYQLLVLLVYETWNINWVGIFFWANKRG